MDMASKVLVTGSSGHLGTGLMLHLPTIGYGAVGIDLLPAELTAEIGDISSLDFLKAVFEKHRPTHIIHTAALHKPHVESHSVADFVSTNVQGTVNLLDLAVQYGVKAFVFTSTTSTFGKALQPAVAGGAAVWIDEGVVPVPKNIYGVTKVCAEDICSLYHAKHGLPVAVLRTARFFPEQDDSEAVRSAFPEDENVKVNELCYRRADLFDVVTAHVCALQRAPAIKWGRYIISAPPPFPHDTATLERLGRQASEVLESLVPFSDVYGARGWKFFDHLDRVYDSGRAVRELGWKPLYTFSRALACLSGGKEWRSSLSLKIGCRGYHKENTGVYTVR
ncbi:NAD-dependent epimerase/dehydratase [Auricularia subglabra TFB-10046 SS5]|nr:NAD-dependent epimerase/dehydratase [Auricularia subglabra TFB-10046 SS5]